jgi:hypothetical protein
MVTQIVKIVCKDDSILPTVRFKILFIPVLQKVWSVK